LGQVLASEGKSARLPVQRGYLYDNFIFGVNLTVVIDLQRCELMLLMPRCGEGVANPLDVTCVIDVPNHVNG